MRFLRPMAGYTPWDKKRNGNIREQLGNFNINDKLTQYKINWREHIRRMDDNRLPKRNLNYIPKGRRNMQYGKKYTRFSGGRNRPRGLSLLVDDFYLPRNLVLPIMLTKY
jgi:hypothetical protein